MFCWMYFRYELHRPDDRSFGAMKTDGTWTGMIGLCIKGVSIKQKCI